MLPFFVKLTLGTPPPPKEFSSLKSFRFGIETHHRVWRHPGLAIPDHIIHRYDAIGLRLRAAGRSPFARLPCGRIIPSKITAGVIGIPDDVVAGNRHTPRPALLVGQDVLADRHGIRIDARNLVRAELDKKRNTLRTGHHAAGPRL